jgi:hypothetical protein
MIATFNNRASTQTLCLPVSYISHFNLELLKQLIKAILLIPTHINCDYLNMITQIPMIYLKLLEEQQTNTLNCKYYLILWQYCEKNKTIDMKTYKNVSHRFILLIIYNCHISRGVYIS